MECVRTDHQGLEKRESAEESLSILPDYAPTVRPPPSAVDHLDENMLNPTSDLLSHCHRRVCVVSKTSGALRTERGWVAAVMGAKQ